MYNDALLAMPTVNLVTVVRHLQKVGPQKKSLGNTALYYIQIVNVLVGII